MNARTCWLTLALALAIPAAARAAPPASTGPRDWPTLRWGMTEAQVVEAMAGQPLERLEKVEHLADGRTVSLGIEHHLLGEVDFRVRFVFAGGKLAVVSLKTPPERPVEAEAYDRVRTLLREQLGSSGLELREGSVVDYRQARWDLPGERIDLKYIPGTLVLQHSPPPAARP